MLATLTQRVPADPAIDPALARLEAWLETMRGPRGYGGPVVHWRQQSLVYTGPGRDWRYEGIIAGYLSLWRTSDDRRWLERARRAGNDLLNGQLADGHFAASAFEANPSGAGMVHEAACDLGLLLLARALRQHGAADWERYAACAEQNLRGHYIAHLWDVAASSFREHPRLISFVPNKAATICEALFLLAELRADAALVEQYALPTLNAILAHQVRESGPLDGGIAQSSFGGKPVEKYAPLFIARCVPALLRGHRWTGDERYLDGARRAMEFIERWVGDDGAPPIMVGADERAAPGPRLVAPLGDILRAADLLTLAGGGALDLGAMRRRLLDGQDASGGIQLATGFAAPPRRSRPSLPDLRDILHVTGWCDKAFRYLASHASAALPAATSRPVTAECGFHGRRLELSESAEALEIRQRGRLRYRWRKGTTWAELAEKEFWMR
jgi:hypothetical protein